MLFLEQMPFEVKTIEKGWSTQEISEFQIKTDFHWVDFLEQMSIVIKALWHPRNYKFSKRTSTQMFFLEEMNLSQNFQLKKFILSWVFRANVNCVEETLG